MKERISWILILLSIVNVNAQRKKAYELFTAAGKKTNFSKLIKKTAEYDVVLFGEMHNNPIAHWLELEFVKDLSTKRKLILGAEMFETDQQKELNLYLQDLINYKDFSKSVELWSNYETDYKPLVDFSKNKKIPFIATNSPSLYSKLVYKEGLKPLESLIPEEAILLAPQPIRFNPDLPQYKKILNMEGGHGTLNLVKAQAIKDATMAHFISENKKEGSLFVHFNGAYHSDFYEGIFWHLNQINSGIRKMTITTVEQSSLEELEVANTNKADFIICVPSTMTKTY